MGRHQYLNEDEYEVNLKDFEPQPGKLLDNLAILLTCWSCSASRYNVIILNSECRNSLFFVYKIYVVNKQIYIYTCSHT